MSAAQNTSQSLPVPFGKATNAAGTLAMPGTINIPGRSNVDSQPMSAPPRTQLQQTWDSFRSHRAAFVGLCVLMTMLVICAVGPFVLQDPDAIDMKILGYSPPSAAHPLGTDAIGRDVLSRLVNAGRTSDRKSVV